MDVYKLMALVVIMDLGILFALATVPTAADWGNFNSTSSYSTLSDTFETTYNGTMDRNQSYAAQSEGVQEVGTGGLSMGNAGGNMWSFIEVVTGMNKKTRDFAGNDATFSDTILQPLSWTLVILFGLLHLSVAMKIYGLLRSGSDA